MTKRLKPNKFNPLDSLLYDHRKVSKKEKSDHLTWQIMQSVADNPDHCMAYAFTEEAAAFIENTDISELEEEIDSDLTAALILLEQLPHPITLIHDIGRETACLYMAVGDERMLIILLHWIDGRQEIETGWHYAGITCLLSRDAPEGGHLSLAASDGSDIREWGDRMEDGAHLMAIYQEQYVTSLRFMARFQAILDCSNAPVVDVPPSPTRRAVARSRGTVPPRTYRTLKLTNLENRSARQIGLGSDHDGRTVCTHLRRGHIRNVKTAKGHVKRWIKPCIVNANKGDELINETVLT